MKNKEKIEIFLLCFNRPTSAIEAAKSIFEQLDSNSKLIVSDNSTNNEVLEIIKKELPTVELRLRGGLSSKDHFELCMSEANEDYFCLFHDDDLMLPNYLNEIRNAIIEHPKAQAFGTNAIVHDNQKGLLGLSFDYPFRYKIFYTKEKLLHQYFGKGNCGIAPFPSYLYKTKSFNTTSVERLHSKDLGKFSDVLLVLSQLEVSKVVWVNKPLIQYNLHEGNDGRIESLADRLLLLSELKRMLNKKSRILESYRLFVFSIALDKRPNKRYKKIVNMLRIKRRISIFTFYASLPCILKLWR